MIHKIILTDKQRLQLRTMRKKSKLTIEEVSAKLGKSRAWLGQIERGDLKGIKKEDLSQLMILYEQNLNELVTANKWIYTSEWGHFIDSNSELGYSYQEVPRLECPTCHEKYPYISYIKKANFCPNCGNCVN